MNQQPQMNMAGMAGGPVGGGPQMQPMNAGTPTNFMPHEAIMTKLNTAIYDYLLRAEHYGVAREFIKATNIETKDAKQSPNQRPGMPNGLDDDDNYDSNAFINKPDDLPLGNVIIGGPFLQDWWCQFWELFHTHRSRGGPNRTAAMSYIGMQRGRTNGMNAINQAGNPAGMRNFGNMMGPNGMMNNQDLKRAAMQNNTRNM